MTPAVAIDWTLLAEAVDFYQELGYEYVPTPWAVGLSATRATYNGPVSALTSGGYLVGSAEQAFVRMMINGWVVRPAVSAGPCFRYETDYSETRLPYFMKVELIRPFGESLAMVDAALVFLSRSGIHAYVVDTDAGIDIVSGGMELGSYGSRRVVIDGQALSWSYGTGLALPRASMARATGRRP